jgi:hypothetical protein
MKKALLAAAALLLVGGAAMAGPNAGGTLVAHLAPSTVFCADEAPYCGVDVPADCESGVAELSVDGLPVWHVMAAFPASSSPRLAGITFGIQYAGGFALGGAGHCGDFELSDLAWPGSGTGTAVTWAAAQLGHYTEIYWFAGFAYEATYGPGSFELIAHPSQGGLFADDDTPSATDPIDDYGILGFFQSGYSPCPQDVTIGACCDPDTGDCSIEEQSVCEGLGFDFDGSASCDPNPCPQPEVAACCLPDDTCVLRTETQCADLGGTWLPGVGSCDPNPCIPIPTHETSWGQIKNTYR